MFTRAMAASAAFQSKRRPDSKDYRFRRARNRGSVAALIQLGAATDPTFPRKRSTGSIRKIALACAIVLAATAYGSTTYAKRPREVKHIILFIGDGMQVEHEIATSRYLYGMDYLMFWDFAPVRAPVATWDVTTYNYWASTLNADPYDPEAFDPLFGYDLFRAAAWPHPLAATLDDAYLLAKATDSAAAATAWATGHKTDDGNIAWLSGDPDGGSLTTIAEYLRAQFGMSIGVVSTVPFDHATPAAHVSHNKSRSNYAAIADEIIGVVKPEVVIGGGAPQPVASDPTALAYTSYLPQAQYEALKASPDYVLAERQPGVDGAVTLRKVAARVNPAQKKLFGLFGNAAGNFESPQPSDTPGAPSIVRGALKDPTLKDATLAALSVLSRDRDGFFVMIEQGDIDWANHDNDYARMVGCTWDLNEAVKAALAFVGRPNDDVTWLNTLVIVTADHGNSHLRLVQSLGRGDLPTQIVKPSDHVCPAGSYCGKYLYPDGDVIYGSGGHTNELVMLYAWGRGIDSIARQRGSWYPGTSIIDNTQIFQVMAEVTGTAAP